MALLILCATIAFQPPSIVAISGFWEAVMRSASRFTAVEEARSGTSRAIVSACPWCTIIIWAYMKSAELGVLSGAAFTASSGVSVLAGSPGIPGATTPDAPSRMLFAVCPPPESQAPRASAARAAAEATKDLKTSGLLRRINTAASCGRWGS
jgi:hypothetical protein